MASGPFRSLNNVTSNGQLNLSDVKIFESTSCRYGAKCDELYGDQRAKSFSHPPLCPYQANCKKMEDDVHRLTFIHHTRSHDEGEYEKIEDTKYNSQYDHSAFCPDASACINVDKKHLSVYRHLPMCKYDLRCKLYLVCFHEHREAFRYCQMKCP